MLAAAMIALSAVSSFAQTAPQIDWDKIDSEALNYFLAYLKRLARYVIRFR